MRSELMSIASGLLVGACSVFGIWETEEPRFQTVERVGSVEIREYGPRLAAETAVDGSELAARSAGFRRVAGYIFGGNHGREKIAMTAPVAQAAGKGETIAMTAPVSQSRAAQAPGDAGAGAGRWTIRFFMPTGASLQSLPEPDDPLVRLVSVPAETVAVLRFSGFGTPGAITTEKAALLRAVAATAWRPLGEPVAWFYDPPWTIPFLRRNEVAVPVSR